MAQTAEEYQSTIVYAEIAMAQIKVLHQPASPKNFEIWYSYATGCNPSLNEKINEILSRNGSISNVEMDQIYDTLISIMRFDTRTDQIGNQIRGEIQQIITRIGEAAGNTSSYADHLAKFGQELNFTSDIASIQAVVEELVHTTKFMEQNNQALASRLIASKDEITQLQRNLETVRRESLTDPLTSLANRKYLDEALEKGIAIAKDRREPLSLLMSDIDHFKQFNDSYGHLTGDQVLRLVATAIKQNVKGQDIPARYGGEEFAIVLPNTDLASAITVADHIRRAVMNKELMKRSTGEHLGRVTISIGVATLRLGDSPQSLLERADNCLYAAKHDGRNRVASEVDPGPSKDITTKVA